MKKSLSPEVDKLLSTEVAARETREVEDEAKAEWKAVEKPASANVKSLDARLKAVELLLGLHR